MPGVKRNRLQGPPPKWAVVRGKLHMRLKDCAAELNVPITYLRRLCRQNGYPTWPGKRIRFMNGIGRNVMLEVDAAESSSRAGLAGLSQLAEIAATAGLAGPSQLAKIAEAKKKEEDNDMTGTHEPVANPPPRELVTLNLIDKVGSSSSGERN